MTGIDWSKLKKAAISVRENAYAPYSSFYVGAALLVNGQIYTGCNVENVSYPVGICAERSALAAAVSQGNHKLEAVVVAAQTPITPCGMCRQALVEFGQDVPVLLLGVDGKQWETNLNQLMPDPFNVK